MLENLRGSAQRIQGDNEGDQRGEQFVFCLTQ